MILYAGGYVDTKRRENVSAEVGFASILVLEDTKSNEYGLLHVEYYPLVVRSVLIQEAALSQLSSGLIYINISK